MSLHVRKVLKHRSGCDQNFECGMTCKGDPSGAGSVAGGVTGLIAGVLPCGGGFRFAAPLPPDGAADMLTSRSVGVGVCG